MIDKFDGKYRFLSNFFPSVVSLDGFPFPTVEHAYQAAKTKDMGERAVIRLQSSPAKAKKLGSKLTLIPGWDLYKLGIMERLVRDKFFNHKELATLLIATGEEELVEGNWWGDKYWGVCNGEGENHLGKILMKVRNEVKRL